MAKTKTDAAAKPAAPKKGVAASDLQRVVTDIIRHKANASENSGLAGQATKNACERYNLDKKALGLVTGLVKADDQGKAIGTLRGVIDYADKLGLFDQMDAFDDLIPTMEAIIDRVRGSETSAAGPKADDGGEPKAPPSEGLGALHH